MILKETLRQIVISQRDELSRQDIGLPREILSQIDYNSSHIIILSGIRRCGKSTLLRQIMQNVDNFYYINFEDPRTIDFEIADFQKLDAIFHEEFGQSHFYFFDEIQNVPQWERFVRQLHDRGEKIFITGSNSSLLSKELGTHLTGRHLTYELFPFSFTEYLQFTQQNASETSLTQYLTRGGFPEYLKSGNNDILRQLFQDIIVRDIVVRYGIREPRIIQELALFLLTNSGNRFSYNRLKNQFRLGSPNTAMNYTQYLEEAYLLFILNRFDFSFIRRREFEKKVYTIDTGMMNVNSASLSADWGRLLENAVFLHLRRYYNTIFYLQNRFECDFLVQDSRSIQQVIQVVFELTEDNLERELTGIKEAMRLTKAEKALIVTMNQEDEIDNIPVIPAWKWMTQPSNNFE